MRNFQSEDQHPMNAGSCAIALEDVAVGCTILSLAWSHAPQSETNLDDENFPEALLGYASVCGKSLLGWYQFWYFKASVSCLHTHTPTPLSKSL